MLEAVKVWPGKGGACGKAGATANLDSSCARRRERSAGRDEETDFQVKQRNCRRKKRCAVLPKLLDKENPIQGPWCRFRREARARERLNTAVVDSLKVLDPKRPIREAEVARAGHDFRV